MNTSEATGEMTHSEKIRAVIQEARASAKMFEKDVNEKYHRLMTEAGLTAPRAVMTQVRDRRKEFTLTKEQAQCMAAVLGIKDPSILYPPESPQANLPMEENSVVKFEDLPMNNKATESGSPDFSVDEVQNSTGQELAGANKEKKAGTKIAVGFYQAPEGLKFFLNMELTHQQFERLTLSIPAYMMRTNETENGVFAQAKLTIFPYQAEMIMRAIYGA